MSLQFSSPQAKQDLLDAGNEMKEHYDNSLSTEENLEKAQASVANKRYNELIVSLGKPVAMGIGGIAALMLVSTTLSII